MSVEEDNIKALWSHNPDLPDSFDNDIQEHIILQKVLQKSAGTLAVKDVGSIFVGWLWVLVLGVGASAYSARRRLSIHHQRKRKTINNVNLR